MEKNIKDYIHLYVGCDVIHKDGTTAKLVSISLLNECAFIHNSTNQFGVSTFEDFGKLILRPLSDMTEDEALELYNIWETNSDSKDDIKIDTVKNICSVKGLEAQSNVSILDFIHFIPNLLSKSFDLFGLIESGLAIDKTKRARI